MSELLPNDDEEREDEGGGCGLVLLCVGAALGVLSILVWLGIQVFRD
jgi:hypothetical protein